MGGDLVESCEQARDVYLGLIVTPPVAGIAVDVIKAVGCPFLDTESGYGLSSLMENEAAEVVA